MVNDVTHNLKTDNHADKPSASLMSAPPKSDLIGLILAGGESRRMGGIDKGLIALNGQPLISHVAARFRPQVGKLWISANRNQADYAGYADQVLSDEMNGLLGPLAGIHSALLACRWQAKCEWLIVAPTDAPWLPANLAERLVDAALKAQTHASFAVNGEKAHPVFAALRPSVLDSLQRYLENGGRRVLSWLTEISAIPTPFDGSSDCFTNINSIEQLQNLHTVN